MAEAQTEHQQREKVREMIKDVQTAVMVTHGDGEKLRGRPMVAAGLDGDGKTLWFFSGSGTEKTEEISRNDRVLLSYSDPSKQLYVAISGKARVLRDVAKQKELWQESMKTWFPDGPEDPHIALIAVEATGAEYWDSPSSKLLHAYGYVKAAVTGEPPKGGENERVSFSKS
ncbi:pyridoxamine 5'-phosphate oxidase family protein [Roseomonas sp. SSH11]|uniref:Pyridoxamine 5'-phosphate oxidase family protein n=1 Tax=Pararoseomonas baculiformis TaxID=2820812 RepID=A0ABS4AC74_9PROT|nr:pyridoxamine 5'-phosphate oxidase family protein [Pararoseomonas baculiformis]MBP0444571.1 pyridoxamine 5'-phosphate oxidase family protein [Pararoseomonas baculiformis]